MKTVFLLYEADGFLSTQSQVLIAACLTKEKAIYFAKKTAPEFMGEKLTKWELEFLKENNQTQGRTINYLIKEIQTNKLL